MNPLRIRVEEVIERGQDEESFAHKVAMRATEAWREYLRTNGLSPYPAIDAGVETTVIELHFHVK